MTAAKSAAPLPTLVAVPDMPATVDIHTSRHVAVFHRELGIIVRAASFAVSRLGTNPEPADVQQAEAVLRDALNEISK